MLVISYTPLRGKRNSIFHGLIILCGDPLSEGYENQIILLIGALMHSPPRDRANEY